MQSRAGFSLIETIVALLLLQVGMLALAATAGVAAKDYSDALVRRRALATAERRAEQLRAQACRAATSGSRLLPGGGSETWAVTQAGPNREVIAGVSVPLARGRRASVES